MHKLYSATINWAAVLASELLSDEGIKNLPPSHIDAGQAAEEGEGEGAQRGSLIYV